MSETRDPSMSTYTQPPLSGRVALVTGGSLGIGTAIVRDLAIAGADLAFTYRSHADEAQALAKEIEALGRRALPIQADVASFDRAHQVVAEVLESLGRLDILVNNAGRNWDSVIWKMTEEQWDQVIAVDLKGTFNYIRAVAGRFKEQNGGKIVNITSINGLRGKFGQSNYTAAKGGAIALTKTVARELGKFGVNVNAVAPGLIETSMVQQAPQQVRDLALAEILLGRLGQPEEVAWVVTFLCTDRARHITGEVISVDGGQYL
ncbi:MAG TPA: 3-oxoacyl-ACP reductase family protein [Anaerolineales bacterium]|nr:3-oxoacyl-ACP reductase family protein [Anaerolineales bacterium]